MKAGRRGKGDRLTEDSIAEAAGGRFGRRLFAMLALMASVLASTSARIAWADEPGVPPITRTVLERRGIPGTDQEMQLILVVFQPGVASPLHHHPEPGLNYILEGTAESAYGKGPPRRYHAGDSLQDIAGVPHTIFRNPDRHKVLRFLIFANLHAGEPYLIVP